MKRGYINDLSIRKFLRDVLVGILLVLPYLFI
jgi:hypothetical protein